MLPTRLTTYDIYKDRIWLVVNIAIFLISAFFAFGAVTNLSAIFWFISTVFCAVIVFIRLLAIEYWS